MNDRLFKVNAYAQDAMSQSKRSKNQDMIEAQMVSKELLNNKKLFGVVMPRTGKPTRAGILITKTLLFAGEGFGGDPIFRAHNKLTGEIIAEIKLPATQTSPPSSYRINGKQYIVMTVSNGKQPAELIALTLSD